MDQQGVLCRRSLHNGLGKADDAAGEFATIRSIKMKSRGNYLRVRLLRGTRYSVVPIIIRLNIIEYAYSIHHTAHLIILSML